MKFDRSNKFDFCYYGQVNSLRLKSSVASEWCNFYASKLQIFLIINMVITICYITVPFLYHRWNYETLIYGKWEQDFSYSPFLFVFYSAENYLHLNRQLTILIFTVTYELNVNKSINLWRIFFQSYYIDMCRTYSYLICIQ